jgi:hypothetical protein
MKCAICGGDVEDKSDIPVCSPCCNHSCARSRKKDKIARTVNNNTKLSPSIAPDQLQSSISKPIDLEMIPPSSIELKGLSDILSIVMPSRYNNCDAILIHLIRDFWSFWNAHKLEVKGQLFVSKDESGRWWLCKRNGANPSPVVKAKTLFS